VIFSTSPEKTKKQASLIAFKHFNKSLNFTAFCLKSLPFAFLTIVMFKNKHKPN